MRELLFLSLVLFQAPVYANDDRRGKDSLDINTVKAEKGVLLIKTLPNFNKTPVLKPKDNSIVMPNAYKAESKCDSFKANVRQIAPWPLKFREGKRSEVTPLRLNKDSN